MKNKKTFSLLAVVSLGTIATVAFATGGYIPQNPVIITIGGGHTNGISPANTPFSSPDHSAALYGSSYEALGDTLEQVYGEVAVVNTAQAASMSYPVFIPDESGALQPTGWKGAQWQFEEGLSQSGWSDGLHVTGLYVAFFGDCGMSPCTPEALVQYHSTMTGVVQQAQAMGISVLVEEYPDYEDIDFNLLSEFAFGGHGYIVPEEDYNQLKNSWKNLWDNMGVPTVHVWEDFETIDGFHPTHKSSLKGARRVENAFKKNYSIGL
ncbi:MAG: hypothetical protein KAR24_00260 [Candidatus Pacebacteria bacterium]|nr:hypothetical protein [Candidatus Paceibacterota bacterium]